MAATGTGYRTVNSLMMEMSYHLLQHPTITTLSAAIAATGLQTATIPSTTNLYPGALLAIDTGNPTLQEVVTVVAVLTSTTFTANFTHTHALGATVQAATFPSQAATDPIYTQAEVLSYTARAQNELLLACPHIFGIFQQTLPVGTTVATLSGTPATVSGFNGGGYLTATGGGTTAATALSTIEIHRMASPSANITILTLTRDASGNITAVSLNPHGLVQGETFAILSTSDFTFLGSFQVAAIVDSYTWTYTQYPSATGTFGISGTYIANPATVADGGLAGSWRRLYEVSQSQLSMQNPNWMQSRLPELSSWYQDRTGLYGFGVNGITAISLPVEILASLRDTDTLGLLDQFLVPDPLLHIVKYRTLQYCFEKDGEFRDAQRAKYCNLRWARGVLALRRWMHWAGIGIGETAGAVSTGGGKG